MLEMGKLVIVHRWRHDYLVILIEITKKNKNNEFQSLFDYFLITFLFWSLFDHFNHFSINSYVIKKMPRSELVNALNLVIRDVF